MRPNLTLESWQRLSKLPCGKQAWSKLAAVRVPYFASIRPQMLELGPGRAVASMRKRRAVTNHLGTVHAIAMCNLAEYCAGLMTEVSVPTTHRWIPKWMRVDYRLKAETDLYGACVCDPLPAFGDEGFEWPLEVALRDDAERIVLTAQIGMWITPRA